MTACMCSAGRRRRMPPTGFFAQILRTPRGDGEGAGDSLPRALASDLGLGSREDFDPLTAERGLLWDGPRPDVLARISDAPWRSLWRHGRTSRPAGTCPCVGAEPAPGDTDAEVLAHARDPIRRASGCLRACARRTRCCALEGRFVPSGAPARGREAGLRCSRRGAISFPSTAVPANPGGMAAWLGVGRGASRPPSDGSWELATCRGSLGLGNLEHAHWRR